MRCSGYLLPKERDMKRPPLLRIEGGNSEQADFCGVRRQRYGSNQLAGNFWGSHMGASARLLIVGLLLLFVPAVAGAQTGAALTGVVTDTSGAVLPGGTVEERSPALIEQVRSAVTDEAGRYRIVDLRPGTYSVTFTLQIGRA